MNILTTLIFQYGLVFSEQEWNEEWKGLLRLSSAEPRVSQTSSSNSNTSSVEPTSSTDEYVFASTFATEIDDYLLESIVRKPRKTFR